MDKHQQKYGVTEDEWTRNFHKSRRMFCVKDNKLHIAKPNLSYSHAVWFEREGWLTEKDDGIMSMAVRGVVDDKGDIYFYIGFDFVVNEEAEKMFFPHLKELVEKLNLKPTNKVCGGLIKETTSQKQWSSKKLYGTVKDFL